MRGSRPRVVAERSVLYPGRVTGPDTNRGTVRGMRALAATLACAWVTTPLRAQDARPLVERIGAEGPLDNDTRLPRSSAAEAELARGDELARALPVGAPEDAFVACFEAWRRALLASAPEDLVPTIPDPRGAEFADAPDPVYFESVESAVRRRLSTCRVPAVAQLAGHRAFAARFESLAGRALVEAGSDETALRRVARDNPGTSAASRARLVLCDAALERGDVAGAAAQASAERRATLGGRLDPGAPLRAAWDRRSATLAALASRTGPVDPSPPAMEASALRVVATIPWETEERESAGSWRRLAPAAAFEPDGDAWIQAGDALIRVDVEARRATPHDVESLSSTLRGAWYPAFGDATRAWSQRPALSADGTRVALVAGRAREERGNALIVFDLDPVASAATGEPPPPRARWCRSDAGFAHADGRAEDASDLHLRAPIPGLLEFQPGPLVRDGLVVVGVLSFAAEAPANARRVDESNGTAWLAAFDLASGALAWKRELGQGPDGAARDLQRLETTRGVSTAWAPLASDGEDVLVVTELGTAALVGADDGAWRWLRRLRRARPPTAASDVLFPPVEVVARENALGPEPFAWEARHGERAAGGAFAFGHGATFGATDAGACRYVVSAEEGLTESVERVAGLRALLASDGTALVERGGRWRLERADPGTGTRLASLPFPALRRVRGAVALATGEVVVAVGSDLVLFDRRRDLLAVARAPLQGLDQEPAVGLQARGRRVYGLGRDRLWVVDVE